MKEITKKYILLDEPDGRLCSAHVIVSSSQWESDDAGPEPCGALATMCVDIETITVKGRRVVNKIGFCSEHPKSKYRRWFDLPLFPEDSEHSWLNALY